MSSARLVLISGLMILSLKVYAEVDLSPDKDRDAQQSIHVEVPKSQISLEPLRFVPPLPTEFSISVSSWAPTDFERGSYANGRGQFEGNSLPAIAITRISQFADLGSGIMLASKFGIGYYGLERSATITISGTQSNSASNENINLFMARVGLELAFEHALGSGFVPNISLSALPTYALAERSAFEDNVGVFGVPFEATVGLLWHSGMGIGQNSTFSVGISGQAISGNIDGSSLNGLGVLGELRLTL